MRADSNAPERCLNPFRPVGGMTLLAWMLVVSACAPGEGTQAPPSEAEDTTVFQTEGRIGANRLDAVEDRLNRGEFEQVVRDAEAVIADMPESGLAYEALGAGQLALGRMDEAERALGRATELEPDQPGPWTKLGIVRMESGNIRDAMDAFNRALDADDDYRFAHQRLGLIYEYEGDSARAIEHLRRGLEGTDSSYLGVAVNLGRLLNDAGRYGETIAQLEPRLAVSSDGTAHMVLATAYYGAGRYEEAQGMFERAGELDPALDEARLGAAMSRREAGDPESALDRISELLRGRPSWTAATVEYGKTLLAAGRLDEARAVFDRYVATGGSKVAADKAIARYHVGRSEFDAAEEIYLDLADAGIADAEVFAQLSEFAMTDGRIVEAERFLREGLADFRDDPFLLYRLGNFLGAVGRYGEAVDVLARLQGMVPNDPNVVRALSLAQSRVGDTRAAAESAARLYELNPSPAEAILYASRLEADGQSDEAESVYREVIGEDPGNALALNNLAALLAAGNELDAAEQFARRATEAVPNNGRLLDTLGWVLHRKGDPAGVVLLERAVALEPDVAVLRYHYGVALDTLGRNAEAVQALTGAVAMDPQADWASDARSRID
jgi:tetratricopeptide (TPR) repeat protein